jgi:RNA polymerase sigma-70 factor (sigma-E family)
MLGADEQEFGDFVATAGPRLLKAARLLTGDWHTGEDLVQATLTKIYLRWDRAAEWETPHAYARKVMVNLYCTWRRRRWHREVTHSEPSAAGTTRDLADAVVVADALGRALSGLDVRQRTVIVLRYFEDLPVTQVAELLNCRPGTVTSLASRGLAQLRRDASLQPSTDVEGR